MSAEKLAFLQNFYTDVTLYIPSEPLAAEPAPTASAPVITPPAAAVAPAVAAPVPPVPPTAPLVAKAVREVQLPSTSFSKPSAGLERLAAGFGHPKTAAELAAETPAPATGHAERPVAAVPPRLAVPVATTLDAAAAPTVPPAMLTRFSTLGSNSQGVVLLFRLPAGQFEKLHRNVFLNKMLQALNLVMADVMLVNVESDLPVALVNLRRELAATHIVAFGKNLLDATIRNTQIYEPVQFPSLGLSYMASATIELVEYDVSLKKRLWPGLQAMFLQ